MVHAKGIDNTETHHVWDLLGAMFDKEVAFSTKYLVATILNIPTYPSMNNHLLGMI